ncbi:hypothetical protein CLOP_g14265 [Closterium sp. NIES-67]|nr:hypothetical protein CLOP_g14265 [Closterium sp. NIES-67]
MAVAAPLSARLAAGSARGHSPAVPRVAVSACPGGTPSSPLLSSTPLLSRRSHACTAAARALPAAAPLIRCALPAQCGTKKPHGCVRRTRGGARARVACVLPWPLESHTQHAGVTRGALGAMEASDCRSPLSFPSHPSPPSSPSPFPPPRSPSPPQP